jgi:hypothetical protein
MITEKNIRKIPKYMLKLIEKKDKLNCPQPNGNTRFYKYFTQYKNELCEVVVAVRNKYKKWYCKQVVVHGVHTNKVWLKDIGLSMGFYRVGWFREKLTAYPRWYDYDWGYNDDKYFQIQAPIINKDFIEKIPKYKYSAVDLYPYNNIIKYLRFYEQYPQTELLVKCGLSELATSKQILKQCQKDKKFCKWLYDNRDYINHKSYYITSLVRAYKQNKDIESVYKFDSFKKMFSQKDNFRELKQFLHKGELEKFMNYLIKQNTNGHSYTDYLNACNYLHLDMNENKNRYPHDFKRWHDIRIDEYHTAKANADEKERQEFYKEFAKIAEKYLPLQRSKDEYIAIIAKSPKDLIIEGEKLHHCVGRMNYDQKFAREESLIFFVRSKETPDTPFVTLEYSLKNHKVLQCYADHDTKPTEQVLDFVNNIWLPYANRKIRKLAI